MKAPSPLLGFNNNVRHKGRVFHIQTEDSGIRHPHIITHLFADGGRILKTIKTSYAEFLGTPNMAEVVRQMMQDQHKSMFMALRDGQFDQLLEELTGKGPARSSPGVLPTSVTSTTLQAAKVTTEMPVVAKPPPLPAPVVPPPLPPPLPPQPAVAPPPLPAAAAPVAKLPPDPPVTTKIPVVVPPPPATAAAAQRDSAPPESTASPASRPGRRLTPPRMVARPRLDIDPAAIHRAPARAPGATLASVVETSVDSGPNIDLDTLERAAKEAETPLFQQIHDLPPPPAAVVGARNLSSPGSYSSVSAPAPGAQPPPSTRGRYAPGRPSSIFSAARPQDGTSIFGEDMISEKSLDEVILSYLAEDLDGPGEKK